MLTRAQRLFYQKNGYLVLEGYFKEIVPELIAANNRILAKKNIKTIAEYEESSKKNVRRIYLPSEYNKTFKKITRNKKMLDIVESVIGKNICIVNDILNMKPPKVGSEIKWHQDFAYMPHTNTSIVTAIVFLDQVDRKNGAICVCPSSHKKGFISHKKQHVFMGYVNERLTTHMNKPRLLAMSPGSLLLMHPFLLHSSASNKSDKPRRALITMYRASDCFPIYINKLVRFIPPYTGLVRGKYSEYIRCEKGDWELPLAKGVYNSIFELQSGSYLKNNKKSKSGYFKS